ncbi:MAG: serine dehydratase subunit alpha family protein [Clostridia bacterium]|nr:serine dehydratase subunit alpha family protein [Clostridia bacterium]
MLSNEIIRTYEDILIEELQVAMGCTEPIAIAYAASIVRDALGKVPQKIVVYLSGNIIKNVKSVIVPSTGGMHGIESAVAAGIISNRYDLKLELLSVLSDFEVDKIAEYKNSASIILNELESPCNFDLLITAEADNDKATVRISDYHTNVILVTLNDIDLTNKYRNEENEIGKSLKNADRSSLNVKDIVEFAETVDLTRIKPHIEKQINMNMAIAQEGLINDYGATIGKILYQNGEASIKDKIKAFAAAGSDARMSGCELPVCIISGSGNQGITASVPVVVYAKENEIDEEKMLRAVLVSDLVTIHQKTGIGTLSAYCGAISAGVGAGAGICYLRGGSYHTIAHTIVNAVAILSGTICDGAKASCAAKIAMAVEAGLVGCEMASAKKQFYGGDGIVTKGVENTIRNVGLLARDGMSTTDKEIIKIMLGK